MSKLRQPISFVISAFLFFSLSISVPAQDKYELSIKAVDKDSTFLNTIGLQNSFNSRGACVEYVNKLSSFLQSKGYVTASIDSLHYDSLSAAAIIFLGNSYHWARLNTDSVNASLLSAVGWRERNFSAKPMDFSQVENWQGKILDYLE